MMRVILTIGLTMVESFSGQKLLQILLIGNNPNLMGGPLEIHPPVLESLYDAVEFFVVDIIILLCSGHF